MERKSKQKPLWRKLHYRESPSGMSKVHIPAISKSIIKPNQKVRATVEELGDNIKEFELIDAAGNTVDITPVETPTEELVVEKVDVEADGYTVEHVGAGWYNVVSDSGKVMNEKKLRGADAEELKEQLEEESLTEE